MWWKMEKVIIGKDIFDLWVKKGGISGFGFAWSKRQEVEGKKKAIKPEETKYSSVEAAFADLFRFATEVKPVAESNEAAA